MKIVFKNMFITQISIPNSKRLAI